MLVQASKWGHPSNGYSETQEPSIEQIDSTYNLSMVLKAGPL